MLVKATLSLQHRCEQHIIMQCTDFRMFSLPLVCVQYVLSNDPTRILLPFTSSHALSQKGLKQSFARPGSLKVELNLKRGVVCYSCYTFANQMLKSDVCMLSSDNVIPLLKAKEKHFETAL